MVLKRICEKIDVNSFDECFDKNLRNALGSNYCINV